MPASSSRLFSLRHGIFSLESFFSLWQPILFVMWLYEIFFHLGNLHLSNAKCDFSIISSFRSKVCTNAGLDPAALPSFFFSLRACSYFFFFSLSLLSELTSFQCSASVLCYVWILRAFIEVWLTEITAAKRTAYARYDTFTGGERSLQFKKNQQDIYVIFYPAIIFRGFICYNAK